VSIEEEKTNMDIVLVDLDLKEVKHAVEVSAGSVYGAAAQLVLYFFCLAARRCPPRCGIE
jgi:hypothetical protein